MSSTNLDAPSSKLTLTAVAAVIGLHVLTAVALIGMKAPDIKVAPKNQIPPIEIELVTLSQKQPVAAVEEVVPDLPPATPPKSKASPAVKAQPKPRKEPVIKEQKPEVAPPKKVEEKKPDIIKTKTPIAEPKVDTQVVEDQRRAKERRQAEEHRRIEQAQQKAEQEARDKAAQEAQRLATEQAAREAEAKAAQQAAAQAKAAKEAAEAAAKAAASNTPVSFTASNADWASAPRLSFPERAARNARSGDTFNVVLVLRVNKQGGIDSVRIAKSSGNPRVDKEAQRQVRSGKFKPFTQNGVPVVGDVTLPVSYAVP
ncbi:TonB family protein [Psychrobacter sp. FBL11]|uniref:TonB family protein n=1 Tax=Psychrobacter saeujeotis TaxID=3143436 RepID=A0ABU9X4R4_9GAMM|nr:energy transducer TonB [uncultured Psychrobacter sp.]